MGVLATCLVVAACHQAPPPQPMSMAQSVGGYTFRERIPAQSGAAAVEIAGELIVLPDTVRLSTEQGPCKQVPTQESGARVGFSFSCPGFGIVVERDDPVHRSKYSISRTYTTTENVCVRYSYDAQGRQICAERGLSQVEHTLETTGFLRLHAKSG